MQYSNKQIRNRIPGSTKQSRIGSSTQPIGSQINDRSNKVSKQKSSRSRRNVYTSVNTNRFNTNGLKLKVKTGYDILRSYGKNIDFSIETKMQMYLLYKCLRFVPGYVDKKFTDVNEAVSYLLKQANFLLGNEYAIISQNGDSFSDYEIKKIIEGERSEEYYLQVIHDTHDASYGYWTSLYPLCELKPKPLKNAILMCLSLIVNNFNFSIKDLGHSPESMDVEDWAMWQSENIQCELVECYDHFKKLHNRDYNPDIDFDNPEAGDIISVLEKIDEIDCYLEINRTKAVPLFKEIISMVPDLKYIKRIIKKYAGTDVAKWMNHILMLHKMEFSTSKYITDAFRYIDNSFYDDAVRPTAVFGYVFDKSCIYSEFIEESMNEDVNNCSIMPFAISTTYSSVKGKIFETEDIPLGDYVDMIFSFDFKTLTYES